MKWLTKLMTISIIILLTNSLLFAHGGGDLIAGPELVGPYTVSIWLNPPDPRASETIHYTVGVAAPIDRQPVLDAQIMVEMRALSDGSLVATAPATTEQSVNKLFYETDMEVPAPGLYEAAFHVVGPEGEGTLTLEVKVASTSRINWLIPGLVGLALIVLVGWLQSHRRN